MSRIVRAAALAAVVLGLLAPAWAQPRAVTPADVERLRSRIDEVRDQVAQLPPDTQLRRELSAQLDELSDEAIALKTRIQEESVPVAEIDGAMGQLAGIDDQARRALSVSPVAPVAAPAAPIARPMGMPEPPPPPPGAAPRAVAPEPPPPPPAGLQAPVPEPPPPPPGWGAAPVSEPPPPPPATRPVVVSEPPPPPPATRSVVVPEPPPPPPAAPPAAPVPPVAVERAPDAHMPGELPAGTELDARLVVQLSSKTAQVEDRFEAATLVDLFEGPRLVVPAGSRMRGIVSAVERPGRLDRKGSLTLTFDQLTVGGEAYPVRGTVVQTIESRGVKGDASRIGVGAGVGAILGGILAGPQGAAAGVFIGTGGVLAALPGKDLDLPTGTIVRVRFETPVVMR